MRFERRKPRHLLASALYKLNRFMPLSRGAKLDLMLDLAWVTHRLSIENGAALSLNRRDQNHFLHDRIGPDDRVLDIGCSAGDILASIDAKERTGIDYNTESIDEAKERHPGVKFVCGDVREYLDRAPAFDVAILSHVLEHIDEPEKFLASLKSRFKRIYVEVPDLDWTDLNKVRQSRNRQLIYMDDDHIAEFDRDELESIFRDLGFKVLASEFRFGVMRYWIG
jgi:protein-L-isoaspartate O-methyltransferase